MAQSIIKKRKALAIVGPTAAGKSDIAVRIAQRFGGEVVSADSRQVYTGLDIGSGKITPREMHGVPHHLLDIASPKRTVSAAQYKEKALAAIQGIFKRGTIPVLVGGTGFYVQAVVDGVIFPDVPPNAKLRKKLAAQSASELSALLKKLDLRRFKEIDAKNPRRLIRAIEIATALGKVPKPHAAKPPFKTLIIGIALSDAKLREKICARLLLRMKKGMLAEAKRLHADGLSYKRMETLGLEYRYMARHLQGKISRKEMIEQLAVEIRHYAKRQMTWFGKDKRIMWFKPEEIGKIEKEIKKFLD